MQPPDQRILGEKYRLVRQLDEGGMGAVWLAEHLSLHSPVAVKLITKEIADSEEGVQRFLREARAAASLRSAHVVQILDYGVDGATPYIVMELLDGESLADRLERVQRLSPQQTGLVLRHVARAVARAHDAGIVHRDLKPSNIFITRNEDEELIKLLDFGIAKAALDVLGASIASNTRTGAFLGTPFYVSPEQAEGIKSLDHRTDIWALGVIAYECLIGRQPFVGDTFGSLVLSICSRPIPVPSQNGPAPAGFDAWFARACARDVEQRFQSVREAAAELRLLLEPGAGELAPPTQHSQGAPSFGSDPALQLLPEFEAPAQALPSLPTPLLGVTTGVASSSATTRRRPLRPSARLYALSGLGALAVLAVGIAVRVSGTRGEGPDTAATVSAAAPLEPLEVPPPQHVLVPEKQHVLVPETQPALVPPAQPALVTEKEPRRTPPAPEPVPAPPSAAPAPRPNVALLKEPPRAAAPAPAAEPAKPATAQRPRSAPPAAVKSKPSKVQPSTPPPTPPATAPAGKHGVNLGI